METLAMRKAQFWLAIYLGIINLYTFVHAIVNDPNAERNIPKGKDDPGVQCPYPGVTGQFVHPNDCKQFISCHHGQPSVQLCPFDTLFNPDIRKCDYPDKVECYGSGIGDILSLDDMVDQIDTATEIRYSVTAPDHQHSSAFTQSKIVKNDRYEIDCQAHQSGLFPHHSDCMKFVQCTNGESLIQACAPGTAFNPALGRCDSINNVKGCEDTFKKLDQPSPSHQGPQGVLPRLLQAVEAIACPVGHTGLLPHPETCKKFLQCSNGNKFIMDCGPGTVFNPKITVCDFPYNVPGCSEEGQHAGSNTVTQAGSWDQQAGIGTIEQRFKSSESRTEKSQLSHQGTQRVLPRLLQAVEAIACPVGHLGFLPHPETCKKFLQCGNGKTVIMDCGPGTVFNPKTMICDWPYNVPGCSEEGQHAGSNTVTQPGSWNQQAGIGTIEQRSSESRNKVKSSESRNKVKSSESRTGKSQLGSETSKLAHYTSLKTESNQGMQCTTDASNFEVHNKTLHNKQISSFYRGDLWLFSTVSY